MSGSGLRTNAFRPVRRLLERLARLVPDDPGAAKSLALLGPAGFGPLCPRCGKRDWRGMLPRHYAYANRFAIREHGTPLCKLAGVCQCAP